ncbi:MAG TPA: WecB/TagA/CpsF family glycosyltransferase [Flavihumibacter sp.]
MRQDFLGLHVNTGPYRYFIETINSLAAAQQSSYVCVANVHMLVEAYMKREFKQIINNADLVTPDGMPICIGLHQLYGLHQDRVAGMNLLPDLLKNASDQKIPVFIYGGHPDLIPVLHEYVNKNLPDLDLRGVYSPPFRPLTKAEDEEVIEMINQSGARLVLVSLGCPKQEIWMAKMKGRINGCMVGIGGAIPVMLGIQKRAPLWMQRYSLEWLYRLLQEPRRLFKRYLVTNSIFLYLYVAALIKHYLTERLGISTN